MQAMDIEAFRAVYPQWVEQNLEYLEAANFREAFKTYPHVRNAEIPWAPLAKPLSECRVAVLTTAGLYVKGDQPPFRAEHYEGDWTVRELRNDADFSALAIAHTHFDHARANQDMNAVYPLDRLRELQAQGVIGELAPLHYSISGYCTQADRVAENSAPQVLQRLRMMDVDVLLHIPV